MKKILCVFLTVAMLLSFFVIGASAALPTYCKSQPEIVFVEDWENVALNYDINKGELETIVGGWSTLSGSQRAVVDSGDEEYGKVINMAGYYKETVNADESVSVLKGYASTAGFGEVTGYAKYTVEFDINPKYASAAPNVVIPWGNDTGDPAVLMLSPDLFTDIDLQAHAINKNLLALPEESLATDKWYHVTVDVNNKKISAMTAFKAATIAENIKVTVKDLTKGTTVVATPVSTASPATDSVFVAQAYANLRTLTGNADMCFGLYSCNNNFYRVADADVSDVESCKASYYFDNITLKVTADDVHYETSGVLYENKEGATVDSNGVGATLNFSGGEIGKDSETNIGDGYDLRKCVATFDARTDADYFQFELYGMNVSNDEKWPNYVNNYDSGQISLYKIPVEESARGKMWSYKVVAGRIMPTVYRAEVGTTDYVLMSDVVSAGTLSNMSSSCARFLMLPSQGTTTGSYLTFENMVVAKKGAMALTINNESAMVLSFDTGIDKTAVPFAAFFDASGNLIEVKNGDVKTLETGEGSVTFFKPADYATAEIFLWDSLTNLVPIAEDTLVIGAEIAE